MTVYNIREKFTAVLATSSIEYVRYYNFNPSTVTDIPMVMLNRDEEIPITVNITTEEPWMEIVDPVTGEDLRYPNANIVLPPVSSKTVLLKIDLPPDIESISESKLRKNIILTIKSGSAPIIKQKDATGAVNNNPKNVIVTDRDEYLIQYGKRIKISGVAVYDANGNLDPTAEVTWTSDKPNYVRVLDADENNPQIRELRAPKPTIILGERKAKITLTAGDRQTSFTVKVKKKVSQSVMDSYGQPSGATSTVSTAVDDVEAEEVQSSETP